MRVSCKKVTEKFGGFPNSLYLCTRNSEIKVFFFLKRSKVMRP